MTLSQKDAYSSWLEGQKVEYAKKEFPDIWIKIKDQDNFGPGKPCVFSSERYLFRYPVALQNAWSRPDDIPNTAKYIKLSCTNVYGYFSILSVEEKGIMTCDGIADWSVLADCFVWSDSSHQSWKPCIK